MVASGRMRQHDWTNEQGEKRSMLAVEIDDIGASIRFTTVHIDAKRSGQGRPSSDDQWSTDAPTSGASTANSENNEPPF